MTTEFLLLLLLSNSCYSILIMNIRSANFTLGQDVFQNSIVRLDYYFVSFVCSCCFKLEVRGNIMLTSRVA